jgi:hypothetical protein
MNAANRSLPNPEVQAHADQFNKQLDKPSWGERFSNFLKKIKVRGGKNKTNRLTKATHNERRGTRRRGPKRHNRRSCKNKNKKRTRRH